MKMRKFPEEGEYRLAAANQIIYMIPPGQTLIEYEPQETGVSDKVDGGSQKGKEGEMGFVDGW